MVEKLPLGWREIFLLVEDDVPLKSKELLGEFESTFSEEFGCLKDFKVKLPVDRTTTLRFCNARSVPYALKKRIEKELDRLESQGILKKVEYLRWPAPTVPVSKDNGGAIRICGDYKKTINTAAPSDTHPIPRTGDLFATLKNGEKFSKLDLSHDYQQLELDEKTQELFTTNSHSGLYHPMHLQFGVRSAAGIFLRKIDKSLKDIPWLKT